MAKVKPLILKDGKIARLPDGDVVIGAGASPGFNFGRSGNVSPGTWLRRPGNVSTNRTGIRIPIDNPVITTISCSNRNVDTYSVRVYEHDGNQANLTLLTTVTVTGATGDIFDGLTITCTKGKQLAVRLDTSTGSVRDLGVDILIVEGN